MSMHSLLFLQFLILFEFGQSTIVEINTGEIRGFVQQSVHNASEYYAFLGIPYAKPPHKNLRFKDPISLKKWNGTRNATQFRPECLQTVASFTLGDENCLYLNVYTKHLGQNQSLPVMVLIHGGGFSVGSGNSYGPDHLMYSNNNIVLVTVNYRLGVFGFLNLKTKDASGNQGLKDIVMALLWVRENIRKFGGDPENVTIFGHSTGGALVHYIMCSPLAKGLFHKVIAQSGVALNPWAIGLKQEDSIKKLVTKLQCESEYSTDVLKCLMQADGFKINTAQNEIMNEEMGRAMEPPFGPGVDSMSNNSFLPVPIEECLNNSISVPFLICHTIHEAIIFLHRDKNHTAAFAEFQNSNNTRISEVFERYNLTLNEAIDFYRINGTMSDENFTNFASDFFFFEGFHRAAVYEINRTNPSVYLCRFDYNPVFKLSRLLVKVDFGGAGHGDDLPYLFKLSAGNINYEGDDFKIMQRITELWKNFACTGNPTPTTSDLLPIKALPSTNSSSLNYLIIDGEMKTMTVPNIRDKFLNFRKG